MFCFLHFICTKRSNFAQENTSSAFQKDITVCYKLCLIGFQRQQHSMEKRTDNNTLPPVWISIIPLTILISMLAVTIAIFGSDALAGPSQMALLVATAVAAVLGMGYCGVKWREIEKNIIEKVSETTISIYILLCIGMLSGAWMISGIVPTMIYYGIQVIHPTVFLPAACMICAAVSLMTGSSWTTIATIGLALLGIGRAHGFNDGWIAGAIISGAYFGDKISPLSDTTVLASSVSGTPLFSHIRYMMLTTGPTLTVSILIFAIAGIWMGNMGENETGIYINTLENTFTLTPWLLLVPLFSGYLIYRKVQSLIVLFVSTIIAVIMAIILQSDILLQIGGMPKGADMSLTALYKGIITTLVSNTQVKTGMPLFDDLVSTSGMAGMLNTIWLILAAMIFGGTMTACGMLKSFLRAVFRKMVCSRVGIVTATVMNGVSMNLITGDQYISIILSANMFKEAYTKEGYEARLLSRSTEDGATVTSVLIPWNTCGMTHSTVLGVATLTYLPYCFFCYLSPLMSILIAALGWKIRKTEAVEQV